MNIQICTTRVSWKSHRRGSLNESCFSKGERSATGTERRINGVSIIITSGTSGHLSPSHETPRCRSCAARWLMKPIHLISGHFSDQWMKKENKNRRKIPRLIRSLESLGKNLLNQIMSINFYSSYICRVLKFSKGSDGQTSWTGIGSWVGFSVNFFPPLKTKVTSLGAD
jgi:hypothetical protein